MSDAIAQFEISQLIELYKQGQFDFNKLVKFYDFEYINQAILDLNSGKVIKPVLLISISKVIPTF
ncbi:hypothetical protein MX593_08160 [Staphylococcus borealis]|uniref:hypothetical protein n=1 Tax=Staphylococcus TaxID=1279 RepID=UPI002DB61CA6|nr:MULTISPECIES: hypothetical protein [Staphylococcus]MEB5793744.1 hypothetical protein [Staphylococcus hominis]MEB6610450.1 hypothetical protein [Staphylococcus borealis]